MKMYEIFRMFKAVNELQAIKKCSWEFYFWLIEIKKKINDIVKEGQEKQKILQDEIQDLSIQYCTKDANGKPVVVKEKEGEFYTGLSKGLNPDYDKKLKEIMDANKDLLNTEYEISFEGIKKLERAILEKKSKDGDHIISWDGNYEEIFHYLITG